MFSEQLYEPVLLALEDRQAESSALHEDKGKVDESSTSDTWAYQLS